MRLLTPGLALMVAVCGCKKDGSGNVGTEEREAVEKRESGKETAMGFMLKWLGHASFRISHEDTVVYIDPWKLEDALHDADVVLVSHGHYDHYSSDDIAKVSGAGTKLVASNDVVAKEGAGQTIMPGLAIEFPGVRVHGVAAYNPEKEFHPKKNQWVGFVVEIGGKRIYYAGDTDVIDEMKSVKDIDVALFPVGGTYTMSAAEAVEAAGQIKPKLAVPYHWGDIVGGESDAEAFTTKASCETKLLHPGESLDL